MWNKLEALSEMAPWQGYSWWSEILQIRIGLRFAESKLWWNLQIANVIYINLLVKIHTIQA